MNKKGFAPILALLIMVGILAVSGVAYYQIGVFLNKEDITPPVEAPTQETGLAKGLKGQELVDDAEGPVVMEKGDEQEATITKTPEKKTNQKQLQQKPTPVVTVPPPVAIVPMPPPQISCVEDTWQCTDWSACTLGAQSRSCKKAFDCLGVDTPIPWENRACIKENKSQVGEHRTAVIMVNFLDKKDQPYDLNTVTNIVFSGESSLNAYIKEVSYNKAFLSGKVYGWYSLPHNMSGYCSETANIGGDFLGYKCDTWRIAEDAVNLSDPLIDFKNIDNIIILVANTTAIDVNFYRGMMSDEGVISAQTSIVGPLGDIGTLTHEFGHALGSQHAGVWECGSNLVGPLLDMFQLETGGCKVDRGGDVYDPMGRGAGHYSAYHKELAGFLSNEQIGLANKSGDYLLDQFELPSLGLKTLKIPISTSGFAYYLEYRRPVGFDGRKSVAGDVPADGVLIRLQLPALYFGVDTLGLGDPAPLIVNPGTPFVDTYRNIKIEVVEKFDNQVKVRITK